MCSGAELELPIRETQSHEDLRNWIQNLSVAVITLWSQEIISAEVVLTAKIPSFTYGDCLLSSTVDEVIKMQPRAMVMPKNKTDTADAVLLNDVNNNFSQDQHASNISESSTTAHHTQKGKKKKVQPEDEGAENDETGNISRTEYMFS